MRKRFDQQILLKQTPIERVKIPTNSRDELPPILRALQWVFQTPEVNEEIFELLEKSIQSGNNHTGRPGMDLWQILVLGIIRLGLDCDYDRLAHIANYDRLVRQILGLPCFSDVDEDKAFQAKTICENVNLIDKELLAKVNNIIALHGHAIIKKNEKEKLELKTDTYVVETNVHYPSDLNLLWDANRKAIELCAKLCEALKINGWRKYKNWLRKLKKLMRRCSKIITAGGPNKEQRVFKVVSEYLEESQQAANKVQATLERLSQINLKSTTLIKILEIKNFQKMQLKHIDLIERRLLKNETIAHEEKIFSLFEEHTQFIKKGKQRPNVELGHKLQVTSDQTGLILDYQRLKDETESSTLLGLVKRIKERFGEESILSLSADKGASEKETTEQLREQIAEVIIAKRGKKNKKEQELESAKRFKKLRNAHSAIESNINSLEHHGLNRCPDKGLGGYDRYIGFGILSYNLHKIGNKLNEQEQRQKQRRDKRRKAA